MSERNSIRDVMRCFSSGSVLDPMFLLCLFSLRERPLWLSLSRARSRSTASQRASLRLCSADFIISSVPGFSDYSFRSRGPCDLQTCVSFAGFFPERLNQQVSLVASRCVVLLNLQLHFRLTSSVAASTKTLQRSSFAPAFFSAESSVSD